MSKSFDPAAHGKKRYLTADGLMGRERAGDNRGVASGRKTSKWENKRRGQSLLQRGRRRKQMERKSALAVVFGCGGELGVGGGYRRGYLPHLLLVIRGMPGLRAFNILCVFPSVANIMVPRWLLWSAAIDSGAVHVGGGLVGRLQFSCTQRPVAPFGGSASCGRPWEREGSAPVWIFGN